MIRILTILVVASCTNLVCAAVPYDHVHLTATNAEEAVDWYSKHFGGTQDLLIWVLLMWLNIRQIEFSMVTSR